MGERTGIEWTDATWNPIIGCSRVSEGCRNCYAEGIAARFGNGKPTVYSGLTRLVNGHAQWTGKIAETKQLLQPLSWKPIIDGCRGNERRGVLHDPKLVCADCVRRSRRVFVNSMSDLFHENVTDEQRDRIFAVMALTPHHTYQVLTKRPERMLRYMTDACTESGGLRIGEAASALFHGLDMKDRHLTMAQQAAVSNQFEWKELRHVWLGVSAENQATADERIPLLLQTPAAVRFVSCEPLLGPVDLYHYVGTGSRKPNLDWVIAGGESGPGARQMQAAWAMNLRDECVVAGIPFFFKQWGEWLPAMQDGAVTKRDGLVLNCSDEPQRVGKKAAGALLDGREWKEFPEVQR